MKFPTLFAAVLLALVSGSALAYACSPAQRTACYRAYSTCLFNSSDPDACELQFNTCLTNAGCPIP